MGGTGVTFLAPAAANGPGDRGSRYTSIAFGIRCGEAGVLRLEYERLHRHSFHSQAETMMAVIHFNEGFYNPTRSHSALSHFSPNEYEARAMIVNDSSSPANYPRNRVNSSSRSSL